jgi:hypothetical protein
MHLRNPSPHVERPGVACFARADPAGRPSRLTHACLRAVAIPSQAQVNLGDFGPVLSGPAQAQQTLVGQVQHPAERCCRNPTARPRSATDRHLGSVQRPARARARSTCSGSRRGSRFPPERCSGCVASPDWWFRGKLSATSCCRYGHGGYLRGSYRIATAPDADSNRLTASSPHASIDARATLARGRRAWAAPRTRTHRSVPAPPTPAGATHLPRGVLARFPLELQQRYPVPRARDPRSNRPAPGCMRRRTPLPR